MVFGGTAGLRTSARRRRGGFLGKYQSRAPSPAKPLYHSFYSPIGGASLIKGFDLYGYRRGGTFESPKVPKSDLGLRPKNPTHRNARPERLCRPGA